MMGICDGKGDKRGKSQMTESDEWEVVHEISWYSMCKAGSCYTLH